MNNPPLNSTNLPIHPTHTDAGVANGHTRVAPDCGSTDRGSTDRGSTDRGSTDRGSTDRGSTDRGSKSFAGFSQVSEAESSSMSQDFPDIPEIHNLILSHLSFSDLLSAERVSRCFRHNILLNHSKEIAYFRELPETSRCRVEKWITSASDYLIDYLERFSTTKPEGYFHAMQQDKPKAFVEIMYFNLRETIGQSLFFDTERKAVMVHENKVHTVQSSTDIPQIMSSSNAEVIMMELIRGTQWVETLSIPYDRGYYGKYSAQLFANGTCFLTNNSDFVKIFERSQDGKWDHKTSLFDNNHTVTKTTEFVRPNSCNVFVLAGCNVNGIPIFLTKYCGKNSDGKWIEFPLGLTDRVIVRDVTRDARCALVSDGGDLLIYQQTDEELEVSTLSDCGSYGRFSPDGARIVSNYGRNGAKVFIRSNQGDWLEEYIIQDEEERGAVLFLQYSPDGTAIALISSHRVEIFGRQGEGAWGRQAIFNNSGVGHICFSEIIFSPGGTHGVLKSISDRNTEKNMPEYVPRIIGKISNGSWVEKAKVAANGLVAFSPDETHVAVYTARNQRITLFELSDERKLPEVANIEPCKKIRSIQFSDDGSHVVTGSDDGLVRIWGQSGNSRWVEKAVIKHHEPVHLVQFVMKMTHVLVCCNNKVHLYELKPQVLSFSV